jgi:hypothetical protein
MGGSRMKALVLASIIWAASGLTLAGQATGVFVDPEGKVRVQVTITDPRGEVSIEHFDAINFGQSGRAGEVKAKFQLSAESLATLPSRGISGVRRLKDEGDRLVLDWSRVTTEIRIEQLSACSVGVAGEFTGAVAKDQSAIYPVLNSMATVSVLDSQKGDADLYVYDDLGNEVCRSNHVKADKLADQCFFLADFCDASLGSVVKVYGWKKVNAYHLTVYYVNAQ